MSATVAGGQYNVASQQSSTVAGGAYNRAIAVFSTVSGGTRNEAQGAYSTAGGGQRCIALGAHSFAAGRRAKANHSGSFVWADSVDVDKTSSAVDEFNVYAGGGTRIFSSSDGSAGVLLAPGGGSWTSVSDRAKKEHFEEVDTRAVLRELASIPITTWSYKSQDDGIRHMGPMAQDFRSAFGLGVDDKGIDTIDADGVALAAIQGLIAQRDADAEEIAALRARVEELESLKEELASLKASSRATVETE